MNRLVTLEEARRKIESGAALALAAPEHVLDALPAGRWIGGTTPYFMDTEGGVIATDDRVFVTELPTQGESTPAWYSAERLPSILDDAPDNGFTLVIVPAGSQAHQAFAMNATKDAAALLKPTVGWVSGMHLSELGRVTPKVYLGAAGAKHADGMVAMHVALPADELASIEIVNIFEPGDGSVLRFRETSFQVGECLVDGVPTSFAAYLAERGLDDGKLPLVGDFGGAHVNVSIQSVDVVGGQVALYAPVFPDVDYRFARPIDDYGARFRARLADYATGGVSFSCNCILNFVFGGLEGQSLGALNGPVTFGEIGYQLLNQTLVALRID